jgi:ribosomal protein S18 acetylase RimI-like enzyme
MKIIQLHPSRWKEYKTLRLQALSEHPKIAFQSDYDQEVAFDDNFWQEKLRNTREQCLFFAEDNGILCGMVNGILHQGRSINHRATITSLYVAEAYRNNLEIHQSLVTTLLDAFANDPKIMRIEVTVNVKNPIAVNFYEQLGFCRVGELKKYIRLNDDEFQNRYLLEKILEK